jgi:hypothetical protein
VHAVLGRSAFPGIIAGLRVECGSAHNKMCSVFECSSRGGCGMWFSYEWHLSLEPWVVTF